MKNNSRTVKGSAKRVIFTFLAVLICAALALSFGNARALEGAGSSSSAVEEVASSSLPVSSGGEEASSTGESQVEQASSVSVAQESQEGETSSASADSDSVAANVEEPEEPTGSEETANIYTVAFYDRAGVQLAEVEVAEGGAIPADSVPFTAPENFGGWYPKAVAEEIAAAQIMYRQAMEEYIHRLLSGEAAEETPPTPVQAADYAEPFDLSTPVEDNLALMAAYFEEAMPYARTFGAPDVPAEECGTVDELETALADASVTYIKLTAENYVLDEAVNIPVNADRELLIVGADPGSTITSAAGARHINITGASGRSLQITFSNVTLDGTDQGGGIESATVALTLNGAKVVNCVTSGNGGGVYSKSGGLTLVGGAYTSNKAVRGAGIYVTGNIAVTGAAVEGNTATDGAGGIQASGSITLEEGTSVSSNTGGVTGGVRGANVSVHGAKVNGNNTTVNGMDYDGGGGIHASGTFTMSSGEINNNTALSTGGVFARAAVAITGGSIVGNRATSVGPGAMSCYQTAGSIENATISNNTGASQGGAMYLKRTSLGAVFTMRNCTFADNKLLSPYSSEPGGGAMQINIFKTEMVLEDCEFSGNKVVSSGDSALMYGGAVYLYSGNLTVDGGAITGNAFEGGRRGYGGGIHVSQGNMLTLSGVAISGNVADIGGGVYTRTATGLKVEDCVITGNEATSLEGGGIGAQSTPVTVLGNTEISGNTAYTNGGGISAGTLVIAGEVTVNDNAAGQNGGGISGSPTMNGGELHLTGNTATGNGGGIYSNNTIAIDANVFIRENEAAQGGGAYSATGDIDAQGSTVEGNFATGNGGGLCAPGGNVVLRNSAVVSGNESQASGGGVYALHAVTVTASTVNDNIAASQGGGMHAGKTLPFTEGTIQVLDGSVVSGNQGPNGAGLSANIVTVQNSEISANLSSHYGGGIWGDTVTLVDSQILNNEATVNGGGMFVRGKADFLRTNFSGNKAESGGGAYVFFHTDTRGAEQSAKIVDCTFSGNAATGVEGRAGGISIYHGDPNAAPGPTPPAHAPDVRVENTSFTRNTAVYGGGLRIGAQAGYGISFTVDDCDFEENESSYSAGAVYIDNDADHASVAAQEISNSRLRGNTALYGGAVLVENTGAVDFVGCTIADNLAVMDGGGIYFNSSDYAPNAAKASSIAGNSVISGNSAQNGGGFVVADRLVHVENTRIAQNMAAESGGGVYTYTLTDLTTDGVTFTQNTAPVAYTWDLTSPPDPTTAADKAVHQAKILNTTYSLDFSNAYNNFDINYDLGEPGYPVTLAYYKDEISSPSDPNHYVGATLILLNGPVTEASIAAKMSDWNTWSKPAGYRNAVIRDLDDNLVADETTSPITVTLLYQKAYRVTFDGNGADVQAVPGYIDVVAPDTTIGALPTPPTRTGYTFNGWKDASGGDFTDQTTVSADITVYAQWMGNYFSLIFNVNGGSSNPPATQSVRVGERATAVADPAKPDATFTGWNTQADGKGTFWDFATSVMPAHNVTLYAQWQDNPPPAVSSSTAPAPSSTPTPPPTPTPSTSPSTASSSRPVVSASSSVAPSSSTGTAASVPTASTPASSGGGTVAASGSGSASGVESSVSASGNMFQNLANGVVPLGGLGQRGVWSFVNLLLSVIALLIALIVLFHWLISNAARRRQEGAYGYKEQGKAGGVLRIVAIVSGLLPGILFVLLSNLNASMVWIDSATPLIAATFVLSLALIVIQQIVRWRGTSVEDELEDEG